MEFRVIPRNTRPPKSASNTVYLEIDLWNDYSFVTMFHLSLHDKDGMHHDIGDIKIGFKGQTTRDSTFKKLPDKFTTLSSEYFSLGQNTDFYRKISSLPNSLGKSILSSLRDIVLQPNIIDEAREEEVFSTSLLRNISLSVVKGQFARVLDGKPELTNFRFKYARPESDHLGGVEIDFDVEVASTPNTNIHAVIGRNGVGKTTLLNGMIEAITDPRSVAKFIDTGGWREREIAEDYFSSLVSVSFSAFDPFTPPQDQPDPAKGTCYFYIGLKDIDNKDRLRTVNELQKDCIKSLTDCFGNPEKTERWLSAINKLGSDENFSSMNLEQLEAIYRDLRKETKNKHQSDSTEFRSRYFTAVHPFLSRMSSGHAIVLLTITRLVATVEEKTLVLLDEPESHLHPPLLSAFIRALSDLLHDQNGVAIIATHSPVVLQEIPRSCIWKIYRVGKSVSSSRPKIETFGENVGVLTSEVFSLEVERSGFHDLLANSVKSGKTYEKIVADYKNQLGIEGRAILKALIAIRDRG